MNQHPKVIPHSIDSIGVKKIETVKCYVDAIFSELSEADKKAACVHSYGVACASAMLAKRRGLNPDTAYCIGLLHDIYSYKTGCYWLCHAYNGAEMLRTAFRRDLKNCFSEDEERIILSAVYRHSVKECVHDSYDEILKDADCLNHGVVSKRLCAVFKEFDIPIETAVPALDKKPIKGFCRKRFASIAAEYSAKNIKGEENDALFSEIIRYFPEADAAAELRTAWCAAFVYHCAVNSGLEIPIRSRPDAAFRLACVPAWMEWGKDEGFLLEARKTKPVSGDIILFYNESHYEHMGIVTQVDAEGFTLAEGNADWSNVSRLARASFHSKRDLILRIPENFVYDGLRYAPN